MTEVKGGGTVLTAYKAGTYQLGMEKELETGLSSPSRHRNCKKYWMIVRWEILWTTRNIVGDSKHTPHDCRHTFSMLCEKYNVKENDRKRILGHSPPL